MNKIRKGDESLFIAGDKVSAVPVVSCVDGFCGGEGETRQETR